jgi:peptide/nickel transport system substrate-binding protein
VVSLDPADAAGALSAVVLTGAYETLLRVGPDGRTLAPGLARSWSVDDAGGAVTFSIDPAARFADGTPVEAADVVWSWERAASGPGWASALLGGLEAVEVVDAGTVMARWSGAAAELEAAAAAPELGVVNRDAALGSGGAPPVDLRTGSAGSGPYKVEGFTVGERLRLTRNDGYWGGPAGFEAVVFEHRPVPRDRRVALESGAADVALQLTAAMVERMEPSGDLVIVEEPSADLVYLALSPGADGGEALVPEVRRAIALAVDRVAMLEEVAGGAGEVALSVIPPGFPGGREAPAGPARDLDEARRLLDAAGRADGLELVAAYPAVAAYGVDLRAVLEHVADDLEDVGVELRVEALGPTEWAARVEDQGIPVTVGATGPSHPGPGQFAQLFGLVPGSLWSSRAGGGTPLVDDEQVELLAAAGAVGTAPAAVDERYAALAAAIAEDAVVVPLVRPDVLLAHRSDVVGVAPTTCCPLDLARLRLGP